MGMSSKSFKKKKINFLSFFILLFGVFLTVFSVLFVSTNFFGHAAGNYDVVVVGAGTGGIAASIQAANQGASVLLLEDTDWVGGQMTAAGVTSIDWVDPRWTGGIFADFRNRIKSYYKDKPIGTCYWSTTSTCFEPSVGQKILREMLKEHSNIFLQTRSTVTAVNKLGDRITELTINENGRTNTVSVKRVIDATEFGDILPLAGANYRLGNSTNTQPSSNACVQSITYAAVMKKYPNGVPNELKFNNPPPGYNEKNMSEFFAKYLSNSANSSGNFPVTWERHISYRGMPDFTNPNNYDSSSPNAITKTGLNWFNDYPCATAGCVDPLGIKTLSANYVEADKNTRKDISCEAKLRTMQFMYYIQNVLGKTDWAVANDEGYNTDYNNQENSCSNITQEFKSIEANMPVMPYVRESRRGIGTTTVTVKDVNRAGDPPKAIKSYSSSIAIGDYHFDLHGCSGNDTLEKGLETYWDRSDLTGPFQLPVNVLISDNVPNLLLAEKNISVSRMVNGATRLQPITMLTGQAAGALAVLSINKNVLPREVNTLVLQRQLLSSGLMLVPFKDMSFNSLYFSEMQQSALREILNGYGNLMFGSTEPLYRNQVAAVIVRALKLPMINPSKAYFTDVSVGSSFFSEIESIRASGITSGCSINPNKFCPNDKTTNAQLAVFAFKGWQKLNPKVPYVSPTVQSYTDVPKTHYAYAHVESLAAQGVKWYCDPIKKKFCPDSSVNRSVTAYVISTILAIVDKL